MQISYLSSRFILENINYASIRPSISTKASDDDKTNLNSINGKIPHLKLCILFENHQNVSFEIFDFGIFYYFCPSKNDLCGNTVNVARFARNVE